ncbi:hypothetical protein BDQ12DRAFT_632192 [Crucibulum laeve]|uniref:Chromo domain-containing protein n=1 Tax=Crucibulum laeve TaxID=68775 RepID=A0A5C3LYX3_9AGAR|nr:hypothetical protein BDQ12DRAFT_632192 [Crucibulum laeve]
MPSMSTSNIASSSQRSESPVSEHRESPRGSSLSRTTPSDFDILCDNVKPTARVLPGHSRRHSLVTPELVVRKERRERSKPYSRPSPRKLFTICGQQFRPTVVFDTFWKFAAERHNIYNKRRAGEPAPWTEDHILKKHKFCNTYRVLDKVCQYLIKEVIEKGSQDPTEVVFRIVLFNTFTRISTWELLTSELGPLTWATYDREKYGAVLTRHRKRSGTKGGKRGDINPVYTGSFQKPHPAFGYDETHMNHLCLLEIMMENDLPSKLLGTPYLADIYEYLISFPSMGPFSTYQLMLNLSYSDVLNFHPNDFVVPGLGASSGLCKMFGKSRLAIAKRTVPDIEIEIIRWMTETQDEHFKRLGLTFTGLGPKNLPMDLSDVEHTICEVDKYAREAHPSISGGKRINLGPTFTPSSGTFPKAIFPKAWSHPARKVSRLRPDRKLVIEKRYVVSHIGKHREGENGMEYYVFWEGYAASEATWEPELALTADAPLAVEQYLATLT